MTSVSIFQLNARKSLVDAVLLSTEKSTAGLAIELYFLFPSLLLSPIAV